MRIASAWPSNFIAAAYDGKTMPSNGSAGISRHRWQAQRRPKILPIFVFDKSGE
jgi:hypothetical protein